MTVIGLLHPGEMGAAVGATLVEQGHRVLWVTAGRSPATATRAADAGLEGVDGVDDLCERAEAILSICPPDAAAEVAARVGDFAGPFIDANAIAPATVRGIAARQPGLVDGAIIGPPPRRPGSTRLYLSGTGAPECAEIFAGTRLTVSVLGPAVGDASALKMAYAAWSKGTQALALAVRAVARAEGVEDALLAEWGLSQPDLDERTQGAARAALEKGWRWSGEMEEIAATFAADGLPVGFHLAAADVFAASPRGGVDGQDPLDRVLAGLLGAPPSSATAFSASQWRNRHH